MPEVKPKVKVKVSYSITYTPKLATQVFEFMSGMDLGVIGGEFPVTEVFSWTTTSKIDQAYRQKMRRALVAGLKANGITQIHEIKKIK